MRRLKRGAGSPLRATLGEALHAPLADLARPSAGKQQPKGLKTALSFKASYDTSGTWNFGLDLSETAGGGADTGMLETDLNKLVRDVSEAANEEDVGLAILIDEAQDLTPDELTAVCSAAHVAGQQEWNCLFALAGLPSLPRVLAEAKSCPSDCSSSSKSGTSQRIWPGRLSPNLRRLRRVAWEENAVDFIVQQASGYPYFLQQFGQETWNASSDSPIGLPDARVGAALGRDALDNASSAPAGTGLPGPKSVTCVRWRSTGTQAVRRVMWLPGLAAASPVSAQRVQASSPRASSSPLRTA